MAGDSVTVSQGHFVGTLRRDAWWTEILPAALLLGVFGIYATDRAFEGAYYSWGPYLSPFYSPLIDPAHHFWPWSPALLILAFPLGFRTTCYYYRKAYYRAYFMDPPACAVGERKRNYCGETKFPFILQNKSGSSIFAFASALVTSVSITYNYGPRFTMILVVVIGFTFPLQKQVSHFAKLKRFAKEFSLYLTGLIGIQAYWIVPTFLTGSTKFLFRYPISFQVL